MEFEYLALDKNGARIKSSMKAESAVAVANTIRSSGGKPFKITPINAGTKIIGQIFAAPRKITTKELIVFTRQLGAILSAGVLLSDAIDTIATDLENRYFAEV